MTDSNQYHSSDLPRNLELKSRLVQISKNGSQNQLPNYQLSTPTKIEGHGKGILNVQDLPSLKYNDSESKNMKLKKSFQYIIPQKDNKKGGYTFKMELNRDNNSNKDKSKEIDKSKSKSSIQNSPETNLKNKITEENNRLIKLMINRKRQNS